MTICIREATPDDVPALAELYHASVIAIGPAGYGPEQVRAWAAFAREEGFRDFILRPCTYVAEDDAGIAAFGGIEPNGRIASLYTRGDRARQGLGARLLGELRAHARREGLSRLHAEASEISRPFFERHGFAVTAEETVERHGVLIHRYRVEGPVDAPAAYHVRRDGFAIRTDPARLDLDVVLGFLRGAYWSKHLSEEALRTSLDHSLCFGLYDERGEAPVQAGFARVLTDYARFAYLSDLFVVERYRARGLSTWLVDAILGHPSLRTVGRWMLATDDAHGLYARFGFTPLPKPEFFMERRTP